MENEQRSGDVKQEIPPSLAGIDGEMADLVRALRRAVDAKGGLDCSFAERENAALTIGTEAERRLLEHELQSGLDAPEITPRRFLPSQPPGPQLCRTFAEQRRTSAGGRCNRCCAV